MSAFSKSTLLACAAAWLAAAPAWAWDSIVYMPSWAGSVSSIQWPYVTHVNYAFVIPNGNGTLGPVDNASKLTSLVSAAHANGKKVLVSLGGWNDGNDSGFEQLAANSTSRTAFTNSIVGLVNQYGLDGIDIDWEYPDPGTSGSNATLVFQQVCNAMHARGKLCTAAVIGQGSTGGGIQSGAISVLDYIQIMAYDASSTNHSPYSYAQSCLDYWMGTRGVPGGKVVLGVPFYGRPSYMGYNALLGAGCSSQSDTCFTAGATQYYNGQPTISAKRQLAQSRGARGIMAWEISQDVTDSRSLLRMMVSGGSTPTPAPTATPGSGGISTTAWYTVVNRNSNKCVDARAAATANGTVVQQYSCNSSYAQQWQFQATSGGYYRVVTRNAANQVWDIAGVSTADGGKVHLWTYGGGNNQQWLPQSLGGGYWRFAVRHTGKCLDVPGASTADGVQLQQWTCNNTNAQSFLLQQR